jgi:prepilin signal peptidase PulO-like enzyme (type II secretory pathway)
LYCCFFALVPGAFVPVLVYILKTVPLPHDSVKEAKVGQSFLVVFFGLLALTLGIFYGLQGPDRWSYAKYLYLAAMIFLIPAAYWDKQTGTIPNFFVLIGLSAGLALEAFFLLLGLRILSGRRYVFILVFWGMLFLFRVISRGGIGYGDIKLLAVTALFFEPLILFLFLVLSFALAGGWSMVLLLTGRAKKGSKIPFAPFLLSGYWICGFLWPKLVYR